MQTARTTSSFRAWWDFVLFLFLLLGTLRAVVELLLNGSWPLALAVAALWLHLLYLGSRGAKMGKALCVLLKCPVCGSTRRLFSRPSHNGRRLDLRRAKPICRKCSKTYEFAGSSLATPELLKPKPDARPPEGSLAYREDIWDRLKE